MKRLLTLLCIPPLFAGCVAGGRGLGLKAGVSVASPETAATGDSRGTYTARAVRVVVLTRFGDGFPSPIAGARVSVWDPVDAMLREGTTDATGSVVILSRGQPEIWVAVGNTREPVTESPSPDLILPYTVQVVHEWHDGGE